MNTKTIIKLKNFLDSIGSSVANHFRDTTKMVKIGSGADRSIEDAMLTRLQQSMFRITAVCVT